MSRTRVAVAAVAVAASLGWVAANGLQDNLVYYQTPTELLRGAGSDSGQRIRLGGQVAPGSVQQSGPSVRFILTDGTTRVTVRGASGVPALFREGKGVVVEGVYGADGTFHADTVLVRHGDSYRPPGPGETPPYEPPGEGS